MSHISVEVKRTCDISHSDIVEAARKAGFTYFDEPNCESEAGMLLEFAKEIKLVFERSFDPQKS